MLIHPLKRDLLKHCQSIYNETNLTTMQEVIKFLMAVCRFTIEIPERHLSCDINLALQVFRLQLD